MATRVHDVLLSWWGRLHLGEVIRRRAVRRALDPFMRSDVRVLDAGCGRGDLAITLAKRYPHAHVHSVDTDPTLVESVRRRCAVMQLANCSVQHADLELPEFSSASSFDIIYSVDVFEHLHDPEAVLARIAEMLLRGGRVILHVPQLHQRRWFRRFEQYHQDDHEREGFDPQGLSMMIERAGLRVVGTRNTFGPPGALAWELFHLVQGIGRPLVLSVYPILWTLAVVDGWFTWRRGNGMLLVAEKPHAV